MEKGYKKFIVATIIFFALAILLAVIFPIQEVESFIAVMILLGIMMIILAILRMKEGVAKIQDWIQGKVHIRPTNIKIGLVLILIGGGMILLRKGVNPNYMMYAAIIFMIGCLLFLIGIFSKNFLFKNLIIATLMVFFTIVYVQKSQEPIQLRSIVLTSAFWVVTAISEIKRIKAKEKSTIFKSDFCKVEYHKNEKVVFLQWKQFCRGEDYRTPVKCVIELARTNKGCNFIVDARNGFEDDPADVEWGFKEFLPQMSETGCKQVVFIMNEVNDIEGEMDMWTKEFMKYFTVKRVTSYDEAITALTY